MTRILAFGIPLFALTIFATAYITSRTTTCEESLDTAQTIQFASMTPAESGSCCDDEDASMHVEASTRTKTIVGPVREAVLRQAADGDAVSCPYLDSMPKTMTEACGSNESATMPQDTACEHDDGASTQASTVSARFVQAN